MRKYAESNYQGSDIWNHSVFDILLCFITLWSIFFSWRESSNTMNKLWWKCAGIRALKTVAQTAIATIGTSALMTEVNWVAVLSASLLAGILSMLTSLAGLPEVKTEDDV